VTWSPPAFNGGTAVTGYTVTPTLVQAAVQVTALSALPSWTTATSNPFSGNGGYGASIAWNGSYWIAGGTNSAKTVCIAKSEDGLQWTNSTDNPFYGNAGGGGAIAWNGSYWLVGGQNGGQTVSIAKSTDGLRWTNSPNNPFYGNTCIGIAWNGSYWVAVGSNRARNNCIAISSDGDNWTNSTNNPFNGEYGRGIAWNGSYWVAVGNNRSGSVCIAKSTDGLQWTETASTQNPFSGGKGEGIAWNGSYWVAVGNNSSSSVCIAKSTDGLNWSQSSNNPFRYNSGTGIAWNGSYWVAVGADSRWTSTDGLQWTETVSTQNPFSGGLGYGIAWNGSYWVAVGNNSGSTRTIAVGTPAGTLQPASKQPSPYCWQGAPNVAGISSAASAPATSLSPVTTTALTATINGLSIGASYSFAVTATNIIGTSPPSASSSSVVPFVITKPDPPTAVRVTLSSSSAIVTWTAPVNTGRSPLQSYTVTTVAKVIPPQNPGKPLGTGTWTFASSADGTKIVVGKESANSGNTWTERPGRTGWWAQVFSSSDGATIGGIGCGGPISISTDSGNTWTRNYQGDWHAITCNGDGTKIVVGRYAGTIHTSTDSGKNWVPGQSLGTASA
jgi:hypothetical protein